VVDYVTRGGALPSKPVLITFDDGAESVRSRALPILQEHGFPATLFVTIDPDAWIFSHGPDAQPRLSDEAIRELDRAGVTIGSHAVSHRPLQAMTGAAVEEELQESKRYLEEVIGGPVRYFGVPLNYYGEKVRKAAVTAGYTAVCTSDSGVIHGDSDPFHLRRLNVEGWFEASDLARQIEPGVIVQRRAINFLKRYPARILGPKIWFPLRETLFASPLGRLFTLRNLRRLLVVGVAALALLIIWMAWYLAQ
jgi:peptidoglycan/xylan/chitin deacetylase (PgdA/CDA1 family)